MPATSVAADWDTYAFTVVAVCLLMASAVACLLTSAFRRTGHDGPRLTSAALDGLLVALIAATALTLKTRLAAMELAADGLAAGGYVRLAPACRAHANCASCAAALAAAAFLKLATLPRWPGVTAGFPPATRAALAVAALAVGSIGLLAGVPPLSAGCCLGVAAVLSLSCAADRRTPLSGRP